MQLVREIRDIENKSRRPDVLVDDELIVAFYDERIPKDVTDQAGFEAWLKEAVKDNKKVLYLSREELMRHDAQGVTTDFFPKKVTVAGVEMGLTYHFEPGAPRDGVTMTVPIFALNQVNPGALRVAGAGYAQGKGAESFKEPAAALKTALRAATAVRRGLFRAHQGGSGRLQNPH